MSQKPDPLLVAAKTGSQNAQRMFEQAVWEVGFILQKISGLSELGAEGGEHVQDVIQALEKVMAIAREAIKKNTTLNWTKNPTFEWQQHLENLQWISPRLVAECKANFAWFSANVRVSTARSDVDPPGFTKFGPPRRKLGSSCEDNEKSHGQNANVKKEYEDGVYGNSINAPIVLYSSDDEDEEISIDTKKEAHVDHEFQPIARHEATPSPSPERASFPRAVNQPGRNNSQKEEIISRFLKSAATLSMKPSRKEMKLTLNLTFDPKLHVRNIPKCSRCLSTDRFGPQGGDCFILKRHNSRKRKTCTSCAKGHLPCDLYSIKG